MKKLYMVLPLILLFCFTFGCQQGEEAGVEADVGIEVDAGIEADVEAERAAITESLQALIDAAVKGDTEKLKSFWHPQISWWNYTQEHPHGSDVYLKGFEELHNSDVKWVSCDAKPLEIHVVGNVAILYIANKNAFKDAEGNETTTFGPWTSFWIKEDAKWLMLSNSWTVNE